MSFPHVQIKRSSAGLGLFAAEPISKGTQIIEYTGERITNEEKDRRGGKYQFEINDDWVIDGKDRSNIARYVNHSCQPNAEAVNYDDEEILFEAIRDIASGEEITIDYGEEYWLDHCQPCRCAACTA